MPKLMKIFNDTVSAEPIVRQNGIRLYIRMMMIDKDGRNTSINQFVHIIGAQMGEDKNTVYFLLGKRRQRTVLHHLLGDGLNE